MTLIQNEKSLRCYVNDENCSLVFDLSQQVKVFIKKKKILESLYYNEQVVNIVVVDG